MKKHLKNLVILAILTVCTLVFAPSAFALGEATNLKVTTVIDNAADYPTQVAGLYVKYSAQRIYQMQYNNVTANAPTLTVTKEFSMLNGQSQTQYYKSNYATCDLYWFTANDYTDKHLSLSSVEYTSNLKQYTYRPNNNEVKIDPFNWLEVIDSSKTSSVTLHFRYNPDIGSVPPAPDPAPSYTKTIDYLGDGVVNPDTTVNGPNDYRLYLDLLTQQAAAENKSDIVFVLDVSGSMGWDLSGQTRIEVMKSTMTSAIESLTKNPDNRISIVKFSSQSSVLISNSSNKDALIGTISGLVADGGTNYYDSFLNTIAEVNKMTKDNGEDRDKVVIFLTDGEPTFAYSVAPTQTNNVYAGMVYACQAARQFTNVDKFYSVFIGENSGSASTLQTITQMVPVKEEKYMVQATNTQQLTDTLNRFVATMSNTLYDVTVTDGLSDYVNFQDGMTVTQTSGSNAPVTLTLGIDYSLTTSDNSVAVFFKNKLASANRYTVAFNVRSSVKALDEYDTNHKYPSIGDPGTDYAGNTTSSDKAGFYSNTAATLKYSFGTNGKAEKAFNKPVIQAVLPPPVTPKIELFKVLNNMTLKEGMFSFEVSKVITTGTVQSEVVLGTVTNAAPVAPANDGVIKFDALDAMSLSKPGVYTYKVREVIPAEDQKIKGMAYDEDTLTVIVTVTRSFDTLVTAPTYPDGQIFENTYTAQPVNVTLKAKKELKGKALGENEFSFYLLDNVGGSVDTKQNDALGNITFKELPFTMVGDYKYTIQEAIPYPANTHITYDNTPVNVVIKVRDEGGILKADVVYSKGVLIDVNTFYNVYNYSKINATIEVEQVLKGMQLLNMMFKFEITKLGTTHTETIYNQADGKIPYEEEYTTPGIYKYSIREIIPPLDAKDLMYNRAYMTYDKDEVIEVTVNVTDDGTGVLTATPVYPTDMTFVNSYQIRGQIR